MYVLKFFGTRSYLPNVISYFFVTFQQQKLISHSQFSFMLNVVCPQTSMHFSSLKWWVRGVCFLSSAFELKKKKKCPIPDSYCYFNLTILQLQHTAISCIQKNVKKFMLIRDWPWWRLYVRVKPLLNVHRTEEELKNKEVNALNPFNLSLSST